MSATWSEWKTWTDPATDEEHEVEVDFAWVDNGIGAYEFWGSRGNHVCMEAEVERVWLDGDDITARVDDACISAWAESAEAPEPDDDDDGE